VLPQEARLPHADVEMVPRQGLVERSLAVRVEVGIARPLAERAAPVAVPARRLLQEVRDPAIPPREAFLQALLARGDRRVADFLEEAARRDGDWRSALREWSGDPNFYTHRERPLDETLPWDHLDVGVRKTGLLREHQRAGLSPETAPAG